MGSVSEDKNVRIEIHEKKGPLEIGTSSIPDPTDDGFVLKTHYAGLCHTDVHIWKSVIKISDQMTVGVENLLPDYKYPRVLGHEGSGVIHALGKNYKGDKKVGDRVAVYPWLGCTACDMCRSDESQMCPANIAFSLGIGQPGSFQSYISVPDVRYAVPVPSSVGMDVACMFGCSALTSYNAVTKVKTSIERAANRSEKANLLVIGAGGVGLWVIQWAKALLPKQTKIYVADITEEKLQIARDNGADETILWPIGASDEELVAKTKEVTGGGIDGSIDLVGIPATVNKAFQSANKQATLAVVGIAGGTAAVPIFALACHSITITGIYVGTVEQMEQMVKDFEKYKVSAPPMNVIQPTDATKAMNDLAQAKVTGRNVIDFTRPTY